MLKVIFYIKSDRAGKNGDCPIYAKITLKDKSTTISAGKAISKESQECPETGKRKGFEAES